MTDATDHLFWNGYELLGGPITNIEWEHVHTDTSDAYYTDIACLDENGIIYRRDGEDPSTVYIYLPDESWITITGFTDGDFGMSVTAVTYPYHDPTTGHTIPGPFPFSNITGDNTFWDYENLTGRAHAAANYGSSPAPDHWFAV